MSKAKTILVTGCGGQLGSELRILSSTYPQYRFVFFNSQEFPLGDAQFARQKFEEQQPQYFINCAAYTAVDKAESEKEQAMLVNGEAVGQLATLCSEFNTGFIHISTDYVFNGESQSPWKTEQPTDPVNFYGSSKLRGEELAFANNDRSIVIRTSWVYSSFGKNFVKTMIRLMGEKESIGVVNDQHGSPTYAADLASAIMQIIDSGKWQAGTYHYSNSGAITWFEFAAAIAKKIKSNCVVNPILSSQFPTPAKRPSYSVMDLSKIESVYGIAIPRWEEALDRCLLKLQEDQTS